MELRTNAAVPLIMHIDLNSCFAIIEQQANPLIRHKPVAIAAYDTPRGMVIASSYEAKALGIKLGVNVAEARQLCREVIVLMPDPPKYREAHLRFHKVLDNYTSEVWPRSIDEFVVDFSGSQSINQGRSMVDIGHEIKERIKESLGEYVTVNVGIGPNRFLAKLAAGLHKPDGLDVINSANLRQIYKQLKLTDLPGINRRYKARLNIAGIITPLDFLDASGDFLAKQVFSGIFGYKWHARLRGWEVDSEQWGRKSYGHQYALSQKTTDQEYLQKILMKLCEKTGRRLRKAGYAASGIHLWLSFENRESWAEGRDTKGEMYATQDIYWHAKKLLEVAPIPAKVAHMGVSVYKLKEGILRQTSLFDGTKLDKKALAYASDIVNDKYGEFTVIPAVMANMERVILDRIAFSSRPDPLG